LGGTVRPLDAFDFEAHAWVPDSGWPISRADLDPFYDLARGLLGLPHSDYRFDPTEIGAQTDSPLLPPHGEDFDTIVWRRTQPSPTRFGKKFRSEIQASRNLTCVLHANALELVTNAEGNRIQSLKTATLTGRRDSFRAEHYVLCTGAIENARLLLLSDSRVPGGVGNQNDCVGRYFADHAFRHIGEIHLTKLARTGFYQEERFLLDDRGPGKPRDAVGYASNPAFRRRHGLLGFSVIGHIFKVHWDAYRSAGPVREFSADLDDRAPGDYKRGRSIPMVLVGEMAPNRNSRVALQQQKDALGLRRMSIDLQLQDLDWRTIRESARQLGVAVGRSGNARLRLAPLAGPPWSSGLGGHQSGTTRMSDDPKRGVTDRNARVHGVENLFVGGGSLFSTSAWQHPTLTIVALALRLAEHLKTLARLGRPDQCPGRIIEMPRIGHDGALSPRLR
jgi:choline dehydrogenase-like flavoprotein